MKFIDWLLLLFIGLKLADFVDWSWWLVLSPFLVKAFVVLLAATLEELEQLKHSRRNK
jgi:hypothetical protein